MKKLLITLSAVLCMVLPSLSPAEMRQREPRQLAAAWQEVKKQMADDGKTIRVRDGIQALELLAELGIFSVPADGVRLSCGRAVSCPVVLRCFLCRAVPGRCFHRFGVCAFCRSLSFFCLLFLRKSLDLPVDPHKFLAGDRLLFDQMRRQLIHDLTVCRKQLQRLLIAFLQNAHHFLIDLGSRNIGAVHDRSAVQILAFNGFQTDQPKLLAHAKPGYHRPRQTCRLLDVVCRARRHGIKYDLLRRAAAQIAYKHIVDLRLGIQKLLFLRHSAPIVRGTIVIFCTGSEFFCNAAISAWPTSW